jgi:serine protease Do
MNTAIASNSGGSEGIGFTIPINMVMVIARQLVEHGSVARAYLGVTLDRNFNQSVATRLGLPRAIGARVVAITQNSPAEDAKIQVDDVILEINGTPVDDDNHLVSMVSVTEIGREIPVLIYRDGKPIKLKVKVANRTQFPKPVLTGARSGQ